MNDYYVLNAALMVFATVTALNYRQACEMARAQYGAFVRVTNAKGLTPTQAQLFVRESLED